MVDFGGASRLKYLQVNSLDQGVEWSIEVPENGTYALTWSFASMVPEEVKCDLHLNGELYMEDLDFLRTVPLYTGWSARTVNLNLQKGRNTIGLKSPEDVSLNIDYLWVPDKANDEQEISGETTSPAMDLQSSTAPKSNKKFYSPERVKSANLLMWLDASDISLDEKIPYEEWTEKVGGGKGPAIVFKPNVLNGKGVAGFDIVWLTWLEKPVKEFQTIIMVYKESDMSFPGTSPFRDLDEYIGRANHGEAALLDSEVSELTRQGRVFLNGELVDPFKTPNPLEFCILTVELSEKVVKDLKYTQGYWEGDLAEMMVFDGKLSDRERSKLEKALMEKWLGSRQ